MSNGAFLLAVASSFGLPMPVPIAVIIDWISLFLSTLIERALSRR